MTLRTKISAYTPSNTDPEVLERIFVQRERLLETIVRRLGKSMSTGDKDHTLLSGPRGSGKTCFLTLVHHRLTQDASLNETMRIAWLGEDAVITSLVDLALEMADQLAAAYPDEFNSDIRSTVRGLLPDDAAESILKVIVKRLGNRHLLLMMENLDRTFHGLGDGGQNKWRAFLQESKKVATLATTQQMFDGVSKRTEAFFGFFDIIYLLPLSCDDAGRLIANVAKENGKDELVKFLNTSEGRFRVRALRHLAGGNHRMYILLSEFITKESLAELVEAFEQLGEELTPYFQERLRSLPPQQARVVQTLCNAKGALSVKSVAENSFLPERNCSKHLGELKKKRYVISERHGKESYYEMAEPLMRLCLEIKNQRGRPLRLIALFLRAWFPLEFLRSYAGVIAHPESRESSYCAYALELDTRFDENIQQELDQEIVGKIHIGSYEEAMELAEELNHTDRAKCLLAKSVIKHREGKSDEAISYLTELLEMPGSPATGRASALSYRGQIYNSRGDLDLALSDCTEALSMPEIPANIQAATRITRGSIYHKQDNDRLALSDYTAVINMEDIPPNEWAIALKKRNFLYWSHGQREESLKDLMTLIDTEAVPSSEREKALFFMPFVSIPIRPWSYAMDALIRAFEEGDAGAEYYGRVSLRGILDEVLRKGHVEWAACVADLVRIYTQYDVCDRLCAGLTEAIALLDADDYSDTQLDAWNNAWQKAGKELDECQIALRSLDCAIRAIKSKSERPLLDLPLEIRELIIPLLPNTCRKKGA